MRNKEINKLKEENEFMREQLYKALLLIDRCLRDWRRSDFIHYIIACFSFLLGLAIGGLI